MSNFSQKCNLLSQYLKEKGAFADLSKLESKGGETSRPPPATTMSLLLNMETSSKRDKSQNSLAPSDRKSMDLFSQFSNFGSSSSTQNPQQTNSDSRKAPTMESGSAQMTIFYAGKVLVFNDFPADKATEIIALASKGSSVAAHSGAEKIDSGDFVAPDCNIASCAAGSKINQDHLRDESQTPGSDLPIATRASLHRFFAKRKDRAAARAPYHHVNDPSAAHPETEEGNPWLNLEGPSSSSSKQFDLNI